MGDGSFIWFWYRIFLEMALWMIEIDRKKADFYLSG